MQSSHKQVQFTDSKDVINVYSSAKTLQISYIGMQTQEVAIKPNLRVVLKSDSQMVDEVVVVAYGSAKKSSLTGSVDIVKAEQLTKVPVTSFDQALQGKSAGVQVTAATGRPGAGANIKIRGTSSISAGSDPLYVIDGVPMSSTDFASINANDIEYMSILKDASATAIYGSRGSNGVILVTTKKGKSGKTTFNIRAQYGISTKTTDKFEMMNAQEKLTYERQLGSGYGATGGANGGAMTDEEIAAHPSTNWADEIFRTGATQLYELNMSGGSEKTKFYISGQYYDQDAIVPGSYLTRETARINVEHTVSDRLKVGVATSAGISKEGLLRTDRNALNPFNYVYSANPYDAPFNEDGSYNTDITVGGVPLNIFENIDNNPSYINRLKIVGAFNLEWKIWDEIKYVTVAGVDFNQAIQYQYNKPESQLSNILSPDGPKGYRNDNFTQRATWLWTNMLTYEKTFNSVHAVKAVVGMEAQASKYRRINAMVEGFATGKLDAISIGSTNKDVLGTTTEWKMLSYLGSAGYTYDDKYILDVALRRDGSSRFGADNQFGTFWAVGLGWNMEREKFLENIEWLTRLKIRGSVGTSGNNNIGDYAAQGVYGYGSYNSESTAYPSRLPNPNLSWEKSMQTSVGLDASFFDSRLSVTFDLYKRKTTDLLLATRLSMTSGFSSRIDNVGEMENKGYELAISGDVIRTNDWTFSLNGMISQNKNKVLKLYEGNDITIGWNSLVSEGHPINVYKMVRWAGVNPANGDALYYTKDGKITNVYNSDDAVILDDKTPDPKYFGSFGAKLAYKGIELSGDFYFSGGNYIYNHINFFTQSDGSMIDQNLDKKLLYNQWTKPGDITNIPKQSLNNQSYQSTRYLEDASYLRLRNITLAYTLPKRWLKPLRMENLRIYAQGLNLFTITNFSGLDPEVGDSPTTGLAATAGPAASVLDFSFPAARTIMFGIEIGF
ncbi:SusC/RagA family TonB-linked outer membrane protein [Bacteroides nordii]